MGCKLDLQQVIGCVILKNKKMREEGIIGIGTVIGLVLIVAVVVFMYIAFSYGPGLLDQLGRILKWGLTGENGEENGEPEELLEAIKCAYYRCTEGCDYVDAMTWQYLTDASRPYTQELYCCYNDFIGANVWESSVSCPTDSEDRRTPSECESDIGSSCEEICEYRHYESSEIIGEDESGYCLCSEKEHYCPCSDWYVGTAKVCDEAAKEHPVIVLVAESSWITKQWVNDELGMTCLVGDLRHFSTECEPAISALAVPGLCSESEEETCAVTRSIFYKYASKKCKIEPGTYYIWAGLDPNYGYTGVQNPVVCSHRPETDGNGSPGDVG